MSIGDSPEILSQRILVGIILVGRLGVARQPGGKAAGQPTGQSKAPRMSRFVAEVAAEPIEEQPTDAMGAWRSGWLEI